MSESAAAQANLRFNALEGVRAIMALWVVVGHLLLLTPFPRKSLPWPLDVAANPKLAVYVFMMLSGFVISHLVSRAHEPYLVYIFRRWLRIFPLLAVCVATVVLFALFVPHSPFRLDMKYLWPNLLAHALMLHGAVPSELLPNASVFFLATPWSVSLEWQFYLVAPILVGLVSAQRWMWVVALAIAAFLLSGERYEIAGHTFTFLRGSFLPNALTYFLVGIISYFSFPMLAKARVSLPLALAISAVTFMVSGSYPFAIWAMVLLGLKSTPEVGNVLASKPLVWLGERSYSIYLTHFIVLTIVRLWLIQPNMERGTIWFFLAMSLVTLPVTILVSHVTYHFIELPFMRLGKRWSSPRRQQLEAQKLATAP